jgi:SAM-dependent methyltransferase
MVEWFEDESFWEVLFPFIFPEERLAAAPGEVDRLLELIDFEGREVLDMCCGVGRHSLELARRGYVVTGVDRSPFLLGKAEASAAAGGLSVEWVRSDMHDFVRPEAFDLAINMFTSFGYFDDPDDDLRVLHNLRTSLRDGGRLVIDMIGKEYLAQIFSPTTAEEASDDSLLVQRHEIIDDWSRIRNRWIVIRDGTTTTFNFQHTLYSARELKDRLAAAGLRDVRVYGDLEGHGYGAGSERLVVVATR